MEDATLLSFSRAKDAAAATRSTLTKQAVLADYVRPLAEADLRLAVRFAAGRAFAATDERVLQVGGAVVGDAAVAVLRIDPQELWRQAGRSGEIGEALAAVWPADVATERAPLTLRAIADAFDALAATGRGAEKRRIMRDLLARCRDPREAAYLAKIIFGDMRTGAQEGVLQAAIAKAFDKTLAEIRRGQILVGDLEEVAVLAKNDALHTARFRLFHPVPFMLAQPQETPAIACATLAGRSFYVEDKLDGIRAQIHKADTPHGPRVAIYTRTMDRADHSFPDVVSSMEKLPGEFVLDGEIVPWCDGCVLPFAHIQRRLGRKVLTRKILAENPAVFMAFDILYHDGELLIDRPLRERRRVLESLIPHGLLCIDVAEASTEQQIQSHFAAARQRRNEGIVLKDPAAPYAPGRRGKTWLKLKTHLPTFDCVVTAAEYGHGRRRGVLSDYTFAVWDRDPGEAGAQLVNIGKAYTGLTDSEIAQLTELFLSLSRTQSGGRHIVEPKIVLEIAADQIQRSARHAGGFALRFPRIKRIRWDKRPEQADRLARIAEIHDSATNFARRRDVAPAAPEPTLFDPGSW